MRLRLIFAALAGCFGALAQQPCAELSKLALPNTKIKSAAMVEAKYCRVEGTIWPEVNFELRLPAQWNSKLLMVGNGGLAGTINTGAMTAPLGRGYAVVSTDTGHVADTDGHWAQGHMQRVIDFAHRSVHVTAEAAKAIVLAHYGRGQAHAYFTGCSQGGQQALTEAQRYPRDFDGIVAGDPANYWTRHYVGAHLWITHAMEKNPASYVPDTKIPALADAVNQACDAVDGISDGILNDPRSCKFDPASMLCKNGDGPSCLTALQVETLRKIYQGARTSDGRQIFPGILPGGEAGPGGWARWITGTAPGKSSHAALGLPFLRFVAFENPDWDPFSFRFDRSPGFDSDVDFVDKKLGPIFDNINPDLRPFRDAAGKLIQYHGWNDPDISPLNSINYWESVVKFMRDPEGLSLFSRRVGIRDETRNFYRLFMVPGMQHCSGGPGPSSFDMLTALEQWVEHGVAPDRVIASHRTNNVVDRTRPLCPFPQEAKWNGKGSTDQAENFVCASPPASSYFIE
ncbi:MAG TPA: tannase/feruloyl esterase family alpha/beta hydrolase [Bryobacteraceae bacterium]|nr:tannase/feruloyl esterase family alpha/beta hydrolase [Bryobacteraceae bacterium]